MLLNKRKILDFFKKKNISGRDITVFLLSLLLSFGIWTIYNLSLQYSSVVSVPVSAASDLDGHAQYSSNSVVIAARCRTSGFNLMRFGNSLKPRQVFISSSDLHPTGSGDFYSISANELSGYFSDIFGDDIQLESIISSNVQFRFAEENHKKVPVQVSSVQSFKSQYMALEPIKAEPDSITVYGEPLRLDNIERVNTATVTLENLSSSAHGVVKLEVPAGVRLSRDEVTYSLDVTRYVEIRTEVNIAVRNVPAGKEVSVYPSQAEVTYRCMFPMGSDPTENITFWIDYEDFTKSINGRCIPQTGELPSGVIDYTLEPKVFECVEKVNG